MTTLHDYSNRFKCFKHFLLHAVFLLRLKLRARQCAARKILLLSLCDLGGDALVSSPMWRCVRRLPAEWAQTYCTLYEERAAFDGLRRKRKVRAVALYEPTMETRGRFGRGAARDASPASQRVGGAGCRSERVCVAVALPLEANERPHGASHSAITSRSHGAPDKQPSHCSIDTVCVATWQAPLPAPGARI